MNRAVATLVAIATLLAHALALHTAGDGALAAPFESGHAAFRLGRSLALEGNFSWSPGLFGWDSTPSPLWVLIAAMGEALPVPVTTFAQLASLVFAVVTLALVMRFSGSRLAGLTAPTLLVTLGAMASAAAAGTELTLVAALLMGVLYCLRRGWTRSLALALVALWFARPETVLVLPVCWVLLWKGRRDPDGDHPSPSPLALVPVLLVIAAEIILRGRLGLATLPPALAAIVGTIMPAMGGSLALGQATPDRLAQGLRWLSDMARGTVSPFLGLIPLALWPLGHLSRLGSQSLALALAWLAAIVLQGGGDQPFLQSALPAIPLLFLAFQEALFTILDSRRWGTEKIAWGAVLLAIACSIFASRFPADLGPLPLDDLQRSWQTTKSPAAPGRRQVLGRLALADELQLTARLRRLGNFMREHADPEESILTPWPGAVAYLSRMPTLDLLGRATLAPGQAGLLPWIGPHRVDVVQALAQAPDFVIFTTALVSLTPAEEDIASDWMRRIDSERSRPGRLEEIVLALGPFELVGVPLAERRRRPDQHRGTALFFLRRRALGLAPTLTLAIDGGRLRVEVRHPGHQQLADLTVEAFDETGERWSLRPTGDWTRDQDVHARMGLLLSPTGSHSMLLAEEAWPAEWPAGDPADTGATPPKVRLIRARLTNPGARGAHRFSNVCQPVSLAVLPDPALPGPVLPGQGLAE
ncbi:MAG: hypothetical protein CMJ87_07275 [Planctomycetes bacterium]|jgi:hypothetical protein|nr:hypothetical protein [Planctomycetota bacterium]MDP6520935.1 hypothetical protein [Planctomycetota bacterium]